LLDSSTVAETARFEGGTQIRCGGTVNASIQGSAVLTGATSQDKNMSENQADY